MTLAVPDAAFRLVQASGRLLRSESDFGRITFSTSGFLPNDTVSKSWLHSPLIDRNE